MGDTSRCRSIRINPETQRIALGMKQLQADPWDGVEPSTRWARSSPAASPTSPTTAPSWSWKPASRAWSTSPRCPGPRRTSTPARSSPPRQEVEVMVLEVDPRQAPGQPRPQAGHGQPLGGLRRRAIRSARPSRARSRTSPSSACSSASTTTSTAWCTCPTSTGAARRGSRREVQQGRHGQGPGARRRRREGAHLAGHQAARRAIRSSRRRRPQEGDRSPAPSTRSTPAASRSRPRQRRHRPSSARPTCPATATSSAPSASPSASGSTPRSPTSTRAAAGWRLSVKALEIEDEKEAMAEFGSLGQRRQAGRHPGRRLPREAGRADQELIRSELRAWPVAPGAGGQATGPPPFLDAPPAVWHCPAKRPGVTGRKRALSTGSEA